MAAANSVPTDSFRISASRIRIRLGGMICPSVPEAQMMPQAQPLVVAAAQQRRQRQQAERHHRGADDAGGGAHEHADDDDADAEPAAQVSGRVRDHFHQVFGELGFLQHHAHEDEQRHGDQRVVCHHAEDAAGQQIEQQRAEADIAEHQTGRRQRQRDRNARQQQDEESDQHQDGENFIKRHRALSSPRQEILDRLRQRLHEQQGEPDGNQAFENIAAGNAAGIGGALADAPGLQRRRPTTA